MDTKQWLFKKSCILFCHFPKWPDTESKRPTSHPKVTETGDMNHVLQISTPDYTKFRRPVSARHAASGWLNLYRLSPMLRTDRFFLSNVSQHRDRAWIHRRMKQMMRKSLPGLLSMTVIKWRKEKQARNSSSTGIVWGQKLHYFSLNHALNHSSWTVEVSVISVSWSLILYLPPAD